VIVTKTGENEWMFRQEDNLGEGKMWFIPISLIFSDGHEERFLMKEETVTKKVEGVFKVNSGTKGFYITQYS
jgi:hypothetical protein